jgi:hypothetical protein
MNVVTVAYMVMNYFATILTSKYRDELDRSQIEEWVEGIGGRLEFQGSFTTTGLMNSMVMGSDLDGICFIDAPYDDMRRLLQDFCDMQTWTDEDGGEHSWTVAFKRNLARIKMVWVDVDGNDVGCNLKLDILLVKMSQVEKFVPGCYASTYMRCTIHEALDGSECMGEAIELNIDSVEMVKKMMVAIDSLRVARVVFLFLKALIKANGIEIPSVALMCCVLAGSNKASRETSAESDSKCWFCNILVNTLNFMLAFSVVSNDWKKTNNEVWTPYNEVVKEYQALLDTCGSDKDEGPFFEVISPFQAKLVQKNVRVLGDLLQKLDFCRYDLTQYCNKKSMQTTLNICLMSIIINLATQSVETFDVNVIVDVYEKRGNSLFLEPSIRNAFKTINEKNAEKERLHKIGMIFQSNILGDEIKKILQTVLTTKFEQVELPEPLFLTKHMRPSLMYDTCLAEPFDYYTSYHEYGFTTYYDDGSYSTDDTQSTLNVAACEFVSFA